MDRRTILGMLTCASAFGIAGAALAQKADPGGKGRAEKSKKPKKHVNGRTALGAKLKQNGRHKLGKAGKADVEVEVKGGKVASLVANHPSKGALPVRKIKSKQKMAGDTAPSVTLASGAAADLIQLAQYSDWYYVYWFEEDDSDYYYWFTADEVFVDDTWIEYSDW